MFWNKTHVDLRESCMKNAAKFSGKDIATKRTMPKYP